MLNRPLGADTHPVHPSEDRAIYVISGPMAAGKSTVGRLLASRFERGVHLEGDVFRRSIVAGRDEMTPHPSLAARDQLRLRYRLAAAAADGYFDAGFTVVVEDVISVLAEYRTMIRGRPCHVIVLLPSRDALAAREAGRADKGYWSWTVEQFYDAFVTTTPRVGIWIDTTNFTPEETVDEILARTAWQSAASRLPIVICDYDDQWPMLFEQIARPVQDAVADLGADVEHVGSTSVPGLASKPVIDIDVVVHSAEDVPAAIERLCSLGYLYQGDKGISGREAFMWPKHSKLHHLYVVVAGSGPHADHVHFRDYLSQHPKVASEYAALKKQLATQHPNDWLAYTDAKREFVGRVVRASRDREGARLGW